MRSLLTLILVASPTALSAQIAPGSPPDSAPGPVTIRTEANPANRYENNLARDRIRDGRRGGTLTKKEGRALRREAQMNDSLADRYARDGLSGSEQRELDMRGRALQSLTQAQRSQPKRP